ncbi:hypothetical protein GCM10022222_15990 [Amycolatopsis ultiminotia]|uniref:DUF742 domain-containing protein n=1 Tax=Amycolatopsis ultiminotia TaxID=543629 RepID=A0ABP6VH32_9PSEU
MLTRGRTQARRYLAVETLVSAVPEDPRWTAAQVPAESIPVRSLCRHPRSVAEVAATLEVPLGVVRVLLDDLADLGLVTVHDSHAGDGQPSLEVLHRVLAGLHRL